MNMECEVRYDYRKGWEKDSNIVKGARSYNLTLGILRFYDLASLPVLDPIMCWRYPFRVAFDLKHLYGVCNIHDFKFIESIQRNCDSGIPLTRFEFYNFLYGLFPLVYLIIDSPLPW